MKQKVLLLSILCATEKVFRREIVYNTLYILTQRWGSAWFSNKNRKTLVVISFWLFSVHMKNEKTTKELTMKKCTLIFSRHNHRISFYELYIMSINNLLIVCWCVYAFQLIGENILSLTEHSLFCSAWKMAMWVSFSIDEFRTTKTNVLEAISQVCTYEIMKITIEVFRGLFWSFRKKYRF